MNNNSGIGVFGALGVVFVALKLMDIIDWHWWVVTLPFWGGIALVALILIICILINQLVILFNKFKSINRNK